MDDSALSILSDLSTLNIISIVTLVIGIVLIIVAIVLFIKLQIWAVMADLSGRTARLSIEKLRAQSDKPPKRTAHHSYVADSTEPKRKRGTDKLESNKTDTIGFGRKRGKKTEPLSEPATKTELIKGDDATAVLQNETAKLPDENTGLIRETEHTTALREEFAESYQTADNVGGTAVLDTYGETNVIKRSGSKRAEFRIVTDIVITHTSENIVLN